MRRIRSMCSSVVRAGCGALVGWNADPALAQPRNVGIAALVHAHEVESAHVASRLLVVHDDPGKIVMAVEDGRAGQQRPRLAQSLIIVHGVPVLVLARRQDHHSRPRASPTPRPGRRHRFATSGESATLGEPNRSPKRKYALRTLPTAFRGAVC